LLPQIIDGSLPLVNRVGTPVQSSVGIALGIGNRIGGSRNLLADLPDSPSQIEAEKGDRRVTKDDECYHNDR